MNKREAADHLGISVRALLRLTGTKIAHLPKRRASDETLYDKAELDRYRREIEGAPTYVKPSVTPDTPVSHALARASDAPSVGELALELVMNFELTHLPDA